MIGAADMLVGSDLLVFAGIEPVWIPAYPVPQHLAEKLHAYTLPRSTENTRVKDLLDLIVLADREPVNGARLHASVRATFTVRATHRIPAELPAPPPGWANAYRKLAITAANLPTRNLNAAFTVAANFWNPFLAQPGANKRWSAVEQRWLSA